MHCILKTGGSIGGRVEWAVICSQHRGVLCCFVGWVELRGCSVTVLGSTAVPCARGWGKTLCFLYLHGGFPSNSLLLEVVSPHGEVLSEPPLSQYDSWFQRLLCDFVDPSSSSWKSCGGFQMWPSAPAVRALSMTNCSTVGVSSFNIYMPVIVICPQSKRESLIPHLKGHASQWRPVVYFSCLS